MRKKVHTRTTRGHPLVVFTPHIVVAHAALGDYDFVVLRQRDQLRAVSSIAVRLAVQEQRMAAPGKQGDVLIHDAAAGADVPLCIRAKLHEIFALRIQLGEVSEREEGGNR